MLPLINDNRSQLAEHDYTFVTTSPALYHSHHFNLFFDQTIDDALGMDQGVAVRTRAAYEASSQFLNAVLSAMPPSTPEQRLSAARSLFTALGHGTLELDVSPQGGKAIGRALHYGTAWKQKYGDRIQRKHPADAFAAGYIAAATEAAFGLPLGTVECVESNCVAMSGTQGGPGGAHGQCQFEVRRSEQEKSAVAVTRNDIAGRVPKSLEGMNEDAVERMARSLRNFVWDVDSDERGVMELFGDLLTLQLASYYNHCTNRMLDIIARDKPAVVDVARALLRECGQQCGFYTFGSILSSPEWDALVAPRSAEPEAVIQGALAISRAMGFGHWALEIYKPDKFLVLRSPSTYESVYRKLAYPVGGGGGCCYLFQGAAVSMMKFAESAPWAENSAWNPSLYSKFGEDKRWRVEETHCVAAGHSICRVVVK